MKEAIHALRRDLPELVRALASAFEDDPLMGWIFPDAASRPAALERWMGFALEKGLARGHTYTMEGRHAAAIWSPPDVPMFDEVTGPELARHMQADLGPRTGDVFGELGRVMRGHPKEPPHFYLFVLGTHTAHQSRGHGGRVIAPVLARCDAEGLPAYLESSNPRNVPFYERHGFEAIGETRVGGDAGPPIRFMWREPRGGTIEGGTVFSS